MYGRRKNSRPPSRPRTKSVVPHDGYRRTDQNTSADWRGQLVRQSMDEAMRALADQIGVRADDAILMRLGDNAVYAMPSARLMIRISRSHQLYERVFKTIRLGRWFERVYAPTIRLARLPVEQPLAFHGLLASAWFYRPGSSTRPTVADLGRVLRDLHRVTVPPFPLPAWDPLWDARTRIREADELSDRDRTILLDWCDSLQPQVDAMMRQYGGYVVHGNAHIGNVLRDDIGRPILGDFDATCLGPWQVDLAAVPVEEVRFRRLGTHKNLAYAYGYDVTQDPYWTTLRDVRELSMIAAATSLVATSEAAANEFTYRLDSILRADHTARWTPFAELMHLQPA